jgi:hypothetical protein
MFNAAMIFHLIFMAQGTLFNEHPSQSFNQDIPCNLWKLKVHYCSQEVTDGQYPKPTETTPRQNNYTC